MTEREELAEMEKVLGRLLQDFFPLFMRVRRDEFGGERSPADFRMGLEVEFTADETISRWEISAVPLKREAAGDGVSGPDPA